MADNTNGSTSAKSLDYSQALFKGMVVSPFSGIVGFLAGIGVQAVAQAAGVATVSSVPVTAITPVFTIAAAVLGLAHGVNDSLENQRAGN